jgi:hypothetical protein
LPVPPHPRGSSHEEIDVPPDHFLNVSARHCSSVFISADYGKDGGGVIEAITKSGSNQLHGSLFELHRDAAFDAKNYFDLANLPIPPLARPPSESCS